MNFIFDLGAVLFHWNPKEIAINAGLADLDILAHSKEWRLHDEGKITYEELCKIHPLHLPSFMAATIEYLTPIPRGWELLRMAEKGGHPCYILSNLPKLLHEILLERYPYLGKIPGVYSYQVKCAKPDREIFDHLLNRFDLKPEESIFIDDLEVNVAMARTLGLRSFVCQNHQEVKKELLSLGYL